MQIVDTHSLVKALEKAHFNEEQAEAIIDVIKQYQSHKAEVITKQLESQSNTTKEKLEGVATKEFVRAELSAFESRLDGKFATKEFVRAEIASVKTEIKSQYIKFTGLVFTMLIALKVLTPYFDKFV